MKEKDYIIELLNQADQSSEVRIGTDPLELASRARSAWRQKQRNRQMTIAACVVLLIAVVGFKTLPLQNQTEPAQPKPVADAKQIEHFVQQAEATLEQIRQLNAQVKQDEKMNELYRQYAKIVVQSESAFSSEDRAALKLMDFADQLQPEDDSAKEAMKRTYDKVIQYFPSSQYAEVAKQKLAALAGTL